MNSTETTITYDERQMLRYLKRIRNAADALVREAEDQHSKDKFKKRERHIHTLVDSLDSMIRSRMSEEIWPDDGYPLLNYIRGILKTILVVRPRNQERDKEFMTSQLLYQLD